MNRPAAVYPGSFDPFTLGHLDIARRALALFEHLHIVIFVNPEKRGWLDPAHRAALVTAALTAAGAERFTVEVSTDLLVRYLEARGLSVVVRGLRSPLDYLYEEQMSTVNRTLLPGLETVYLPTRPELAHVSSSRVRELWAYGAPIAALVPPEVAGGLPPPAWGTPV
jgi:pantetheine-phosphate adenylyltransferase